jgi:hypothetical protein
MFPFYPSRMRRRFFQPSLIRARRTGESSVSAAGSSDGGALLLGGFAGPLKTNGLLIVSRASKRIAAPKSAFV